ncbi:MAG: TlpA family protein disulfide reductase [Propionibacteriales bacterium]|nr:TlpA family protein disulfide reductase [Propionibacteriales bacterium]
MTRVGRLLACLLVLGMLAACQEQSPVTRRSSTEPTAAPSAPSFPTDDPDLTRQKKAAGMPDCTAGAPDVPAIADGLPDVTLPCLGGGTPVRLAGLRGTPMVINVWAQWCGPCRTEAPYLAEVSAELTDRVAFLGVDFADPQAERAIAFAGDAGWKYPQVADDARVVQAPLGMVGPPMTVLVDAEGRIVYKHPGVITSSDQLRSMINERLGVAG